MLSTVELLRDANLDNTEAAITKDEKKINDKLEPLGISVAYVNKYVDSTLFVLTPNSMAHQENIKRWFMRAHHRYSFEFTQINSIDIIKDDNGAHLGRMPGRRSTMAIRRHAFKKLPRPFLCSMMIQMLLTLLLLSLLFVMYRVYLM